MGGSSSRKPPTLIPLCALGASDSGESLELLFETLLGPPSATSPNSLSVSAVSSISGILSGGRRWGKTLE